MPIVTIKLAKGRTIEKKRELVEALTKAVTETLGTNREWVTVLIEEWDRSNWAAGGELFIDKFGEGFGSQGVNDK